MPEGLEAELYRRAAERVVGRTIARVDVDERQAEADEFRQVLPGRTVVGVERVGKLVIIETDGPSIGLHFGMAGRLIVDDDAPIEQLVYGGTRDEPKWDRLVITFTDQSTLRVNDPRRWARFTLAPDPDALGPDLFDIDAPTLYERLQRRTIPIKAALLDQSLVAGLGNMLIDELLWRTGIDPRRPANEVSRRKVGDLVRAMRERLPIMLEDGGSHTGVLNPDIRAAAGACPRDGGALRRDEVGGRTTVWCPRHQR